MKAQPPEFPTTLQEAMHYFSDPQRGLDFMVSLRWPDSKVACPHCRSEKISFLSTRQKWKCMSCHKQFSAKAGTVFEDSALGYDKWFPAMWMIVNAKNGISSYEIARALGVTQKTAWFMLQRIRLAMQTGTFEKFGGEVEADETFIGAKSKNLSRATRRKRFQRQIETGMYPKMPVHGLLQRSEEKQGSKVILRVLESTRKNPIMTQVRTRVTEGATIYTDSLPSYRTLHESYRHKFVDHTVRYVNGKIHTNGIENFWSLLKRTLKGTYVSVDPVHLFRYLDEQAFRFNERKDCDGGRFLKAAKGIVGRGLTYLELVESKGGEDLLPA